MNIFRGNTRFNIAALVPLLLIGFAHTAAHAQENEPAIYKCKNCVMYAGWRGVLDFGLGYVSEDSLRFGDYRGLEEKGLVAALDGDVHFRNLQGRYFDLYVDDLPHDSRRVEMRGGNQGFYELRFGWQEIPKYRGDGAQTPYLGVRSDQLTLPADWVHASSTGAMTALQSSLEEAALKTQRKVLDAGITVNFASNVSYRIDYQRQKKSGTRALSGGLYLNDATLLPAPVDFTTDQFDMALAWTGKRGQLQVGFIGSEFDNGNSSVTWENPFSASTEIGFFRAALEPNNEFYQFNLSGAFALTPRIRLSGHASSGRMTQNDPFIPYTINPNFSDQPLPRQSLDGKLDINTYNLGGKLQARLNNRLSFTARGKVDKRENKTPVDIYTPVVTDLVPSVDRYNHPYGYERQQYSADLRYKLFRNVRLSGGAKREKMDRTLQAVESSEEDTWWGELKVSPWAIAQLRVKLESSNRDIDDYQPVDDGNLVDNPLLRKFNQADRDRDRLLVELDLMPAGAFGLNLSYFKAEADYTKSEIGLQDSNEESYTINLNYAMSEKFNLYAFLTRDDIDAGMRNVDGVSRIPWTAMTQDRITTAGIGLSARMSEKSSFGLDFVSSDSKGDILVQTGNEDPFSPLKTDLANARLHFDHEFGDHWGYKLYAEYEKYSAHDWATDGLDVDGISKVLTFGQQSPDYNAWYFRVQASYRF